MIRSALLESALGLAVLAALAAPSCESGPRFSIDMSSKPKASGSGDSEYWVLYLDWNNLHRDLQRDLDNPRITGPGLSSGFNRATVAFEMLEEYFPPAEHEGFQNLRAIYEELKNDLSGGGNRNIVLQRLDDLGKAIRARYHPDRLPENSPTESSGRAVPAAAAPESQPE